MEEMLTRMFCTLMRYDEDEELAFAAFKSLLLYRSQKYSFAQILEQVNWPTLIVQTLPQDPVPCVQQ